MQPLPRPLELVFRTFSSTSIEHKRSVADEFAGDGVLAVIGARDFTYGSVRLAETHHIPVIDVNAVPRTIFERTDPWLFTIRAAQDLVYLAYVGWAQQQGLLDGRRIGVFSDRYTATSTRAVLDRLAALGHRPAVHVESDGVGVGSAHDLEAARHFHDAGVDVVLPFVSGSSLARLLRALAELEHHAVVVDLETGEHATDVSGSVMPAALYEGTQALVMSRVGEVAAGRPLDATAERAVVAVESATGRAIARSGRDSSGELSNILLVADLVAVLCTALRKRRRGHRTRVARRRDRTDRLDAERQRWPPHVPARRALGMPGSTSDRMAGRAVARRVRLPADRHLDDVTASAD